MSATIRQAALDVQNGSNPKPPIFELDGAVIFYIRRRYGNTTYTWVHIVTGPDSSATLGDPWPCITPKRSELIQAIRHHRLEVAALAAGYRIDINHEWRNEEFVMRLTPAGDVEIIQDRLHGEPFPMPAAVALGVNRG